MKNTSKNITFNSDDFKVRNLFIDIQITNSINDSCGASTNVRNSKIIDGYITDVDILFKISGDVSKEPFIYYIKSVIFHEVLHVFQHYNILLNNKFRPESFSIGSIIPQLRKMISTKYINYFLDVLYYSLSHELSAQLHQYYMYNRSGKKYEQLDKIRSLLINFHIKELDEIESRELDVIKNHILNSIKFYTNNKKYLKSLSKSIWNKKNSEFLSIFKNMMNDKVDWLDRKIKMINNKPLIDYSENFTYYGNLEDYEYISIDYYINRNLNDCPRINYI